MHLWQGYGTACYSKSHSPTSTNATSMASVSGPHRDARHFQTVHKLPDQKDRRQLQRATSVDFSLTRQDSPHSPTGETEGRSGNSSTRRRRRRRSKKKKSDDKAGSPRVQLPRLTLSVDRGRFSDEFLPPHRHGLHTRARQMLARHYNSVRMHQMESGTCVDTWQLYLQRS